MSATAVIIVVVLAVIIIVLAAALIARPAMRRRRLKNDFGPEYDRTVEDKGDVRGAEKDLTNRQRRHQELELRPLSAEHRARYLQDWSAVQEQFVDSPRVAGGGGGEGPGGGGGGRG